MEKQRFNAMDVTKMICAVIVVMAHVVPFGDHSSGIWYELNYSVKNGISRVAVPFFFVSSSFFLFRRTDPENVNPAPIKKYCMKILKLYVIWTILYLPIILYDYCNNDKSMLHNLVSFVRNFLFDASYIHLWYLNALFYSVAAVGFLLWKKVSIRKILFIAFVFYFIGIFTQSWYGAVAPLETVIPALWKICGLIKKVIGTTRDALFNGMMYVAIGAYFGIEKPKIPRKKETILFLVSLLLFLVEVFTLRELGWVKDCNSYLLSVPATFFLFAFVRDTVLPNKPIYVTLSTLSTLVYFVHLWFGFAAGFLIKAIGNGSEKTPLAFVFTLVGSVLLGLLIMKLSQKPSWKWLKFLYS